LTGTPSGIWANKNPPPDTGDGLKNQFVTRLSVQLPIAGAILMTALRRHGAQIIMAAGLGVQCKLAMRVFIC
jgi:hypothetical protein